MATVPTHPPPPVEHGWAPCPLVREWDWESAFSTSSWVSWKLLVWGLRGGSVLETRLGSFPANILLRKKFKPTETLTLKWIPIPAYFLYFIISFFLSYLPVHHQSVLLFFFSETYFSWSSFRFTVKLEQSADSRIFLSAPQSIASPVINLLHQMVPLFTTQGPALMLLLPRV